MIDMELFKSWNYATVSETVWLAYLSKLGSNKYIEINIWSLNQTVKKIIKWLWINIKYDTDQDNFGNSKLELVKYFKKIKWDYLFVFKNRESMFFNDHNAISNFFSLIVDTAYECENIKFLFIVSNFTKLQGKTVWIIEEISLALKDRNLIKDYFVKIDLWKFNKVMPIIKTIEEGYISWKNINLDSLWDVLSDEEFFTPWPTIIEIYTEFIDKDMVLKILEIISNLKRTIPLYWIVK